ncbi:hypothetical protein [Actinoplanes sp. N902-109]|uniref:hypothetical protein n=1 Tax=Actinoplanes sp. (strain N902-109) TaxID=649831 RepID=UPI0003294379|nr:hypothetical protein [Actinoplanes sp. N902-109]AGL18393.1 hypothetical protein L083_4883 [Actinoplanes sp. N902-109]
MPIGMEVTLERLKAVLEGLDRARPPAVIADRCVSVRTKVSLASWGERVTCTLVPADDGFLIRVESKTSVVTTMIDDGANRRNVEQVVRALGLSRISER